MTEPTPEEKASHIIYGGSLWVRAQKGSHSVRNVVDVDQIIAGEREKREAAEVKLVEFKSSHLDPKSYLNQLEAQIAAKDEALREIIAVAEARAKSSMAYTAGSMAADNEVYARIAKSSLSTDGSEVEKMRRVVEAARKVQASCDCCGGCGTDCMAGEYEKPCRNCGELKQALDALEGRKGEENATN